jgi:NADP-dependent 3-hydroxy acid dehydrogenase YdfG
MPIAIVTGGNSGIGRACAAALAARGFDVGITWHEDEENLEEALAELRGHGVRAEQRHADFERVPGADAAIDELADALGGLDAFVANAAAGHSTPFLDTDADTFRRVLDLTLFAPFLCARRAARRMLDQGRGGRIVNVTSVHEHVPLTGSCGYTAGKHGLGGLTKVMALERFDRLAAGAPFAVFFEPPSLDDRIVNQSAVLSAMASPEASMDDWLDEHAQLWHAWRITPGAREEIRARLDQANITERVLFPSLDGLAAGLRRYYSPTESAADEGGAAMALPVSAGTDQGEQR